MENLYSSIALVDVSHIFRHRWHAQESTAEQNTAALDSFHEIKDYANTHGHVIACLDAPPYIRTTMFSEYKAKRTPPSAGLIRNLTWLKKRIELEGIRVATAEGYEADDIIATLVGGLRLVCDDIRIIGRDKDLYQLVNHKVRIFHRAFGKQPAEYINAEAVIAKTHGVKPSQIVDWLALMGDSTDNIPGLRGVGDVKAAHILKNWPTLEKLYEAVEREPLSVSKVMGKSIFTNIVQGKATVMAARALVRLMTDAPVDIDDLLKKRAPQPLEENNGFEDAVRNGEIDFSLPPAPTLDDLEREAIESEPVRVGSRRTSEPPVAPANDVPPEDDEVDPADFISGPPVARPAEVRLPVDWAAQPEVMAKKAEPAPKSEPKAAPPPPAPEPARYNPEPTPPKGETPAKYAAQQFDAKSHVGEIVTADRGGALITQVEPGFMLALEPRNMEQACWLAKTLESSLLFPKLGRWQAILAILVMGREIGLSAMTALMNFDMVEGRPSPKWQLIVAMAHQHHDCEYFKLVESTNQKATFVTKRRSHSEPAPPMSFSIEDAMRAGLVKPHSGWDKYPAALCRKMAAVHLVRAVYPDNRAAGLYFPEEMGQDSGDEAAA